MPEPKKEFPFKLGADPEFNFTFQQKRIIAQALLQSAMKGRLEQNMGFQIGTAGNLGWDGNSATAEIRPTPSKSPKDLVENIGKLLAAAAKPAKLFKLSTLSNSAPVGGHIHFELSPAQKEASKQQMTNLHKKLATYFLPIMMGENKINLRLRLNTSYGMMKDWRTENGKTYEFRTPSAEWITTPKIAEGVLSYLGCVWHEASNNPDTFKGDKMIYRTEKQGNAIQEMVVSDYGMLEDVFLKELRKNVKKFELYPLFKEQIDYVLTPNKVLMDKEQVGYNIKQGWAFPEEGKIPSKRELHNKRQMIKKLGGMNMDSMLRLIQIPMNQDTNVSLFIQELKKIILAYGWNLENNYHVFGLKDDVDGYAVMDFSGKYAAGAFTNTIDACKTTGDFKVIHTTMQRMKDKLVSSRSASAEPGKNIIIGLNFKDRLKEDSKPFLDIVHGVEKKIFEMKDISPGRYESKSDSGIIYDIYHKAPSDDVSMVEEGNRFASMSNDIPRMRYGRDFDTEASSDDDDDDDEEYDPDDKVAKLLRDTVVDYVQEIMENEEVPSTSDHLKWLKDDGEITNKQYKDYVRNNHEGLEKRRDG